MDWQGKGSEAKREGYIIKWIANGLLTLQVKILLAMQYMIRIIPSVMVRQIPTIRKWFSYSCG